ncbi:MAG TPA: hypothetical protein VF857_11425, partial [Spirochaetota bacterium]
IITVIALFFGGVYLRFSSRASSKSEGADQNKAGLIKEKTKSPEEMIMSEIEKLAISIDADSITFTFIAHDPHTSDQTIGWKDHQFFTGAKSKGSPIEKKKEIRDELSSGSSILRDRGKRAIVPVIRKKDLAGIITITTIKKMTGSELSIAEKYAKGISRHL